jgi:hypothetical protein
MKLGFSVYCIGGCPIFVFFQFPAICNNNVVFVVDCEVETTLAPLKWCVVAELI